MLRRCEVFGKGGGFVFNAVHNIQANVPVANVVAMFRALDEANGTGVKGALMKSRKAYVVFVSVIAALGGLLFGFDTAIIAGATRFLKDQFALSSFGEGLAVSIVLVGCMFGAMIAGTLSDRTRPEALPSRFGRPVFRLGHRLRHSPEP